MTESSEKRRRRSAWKTHRTRVPHLEYERGDHLVVRSEARAQTRDAPHHCGMAKCPSGEVALSFTLTVPEVADGDPPQIGRYVDQVTKTDWPPPGTRIRVRIES